MAKTKTKPKAAAKKPSAADRYASQVTAETKLKFGPEDSQLAAALKDAQRTYGSDVTAAHGTRRAIEEAAKTSKPKFTQDAAVARSDVDKTQAELDASLNALPNAGALAGAASRDAEGTRRRLSEMLANAKMESDTRQREAATGEAYAVQAARTRLSDSAGKISDRLSEQSQEKGAFAQARSGELVEAGRDRSVTRRGQNVAADTARRNRVTQNKNADADRTSRENIAVAKQKEQDKKDHARKVAKPEAVEKARTALSRAIDQAKRVKAEGGGRARSESAWMLVNGRGERVIKNAPRDMKIGGVDYKAGDALANPIKIPGVAKTEQLSASVALDIAYDGHVSTANMRRLQKLGLSVEDLGLSTAGRSGTEASKRAAAVKAARDAANPVKPKPVRSGVNALRPGVGSILPAVKAKR